MMLAVGTKFKASKYKISAWNLKTPQNMSKGRQFPLPRKKKKTKDNTFVILKKSDTRYFSCLFMIAT